MSLIYITSNRWLITYEDEEPFYLAPASSFNRSVVFIDWSFAAFSLETRAPTLDGIERRRRRSLISLAKYVKIRWCRWLLRCWTRGTPSGPLSIASLWPSHPFPFRLLCRAVHTFVMQMNSHKKQQHIQYTKSKVILKAAWC